MRIWRNRKRAENNHCCAELGQKRLDWTRKCVIRWFYRQSEFKLVVTKAQAISCGWQSVLKLEGISTHNQPRPIHDKEQASDYTHHLVGTMTIDWFKYVTKLLSIEMRHKIVGTDWIVAVNSKFRKARYALCFQINFDIRGNLSKTGKTYLQRKWNILKQSSILGPFLPVTRRKVIS